LFDDAYVENATSKKIQSQAKAPDYRKYLIIAHNWVLLVKISAARATFRGKIKGLTENAKFVAQPNSDPDSASPRAGMQQAATNWTRKPVRRDSAGVSRAAPLCAWTLAQTTP
jgi:hypothetical protein